MGRKFSQRQSTDDCTRVTDLACTVLNRGNLEWTPAWLPLSSDILFLYRSSSQSQTTCSFGHHIDKYPVINLPIPSRP